ncbi:MAG: hypothetical protein QM763_04185 [Agriterribacter sp.]
MPQGTILQNTIETSNPVRSDYSPCSWGYEPYKVFTKEDCVTLTIALEECIHDNIKLQGTDEPDLGGGLAVPVVKQMIDFMKFGDFIFVWDD